MKRLKVLMSAYACEPGRGSEPGIGWSVVREMGRYHDLWVLTCTDHRTAVEAELAQNPQRGVNFVYWDLPWARFWHRDRRGAHLHYYLWQLCIIRIARILHAEVKFDLIHHVTLGRYGTPSFLCFLGVPFVWGPVGGGESMPKRFWMNTGLWGVGWESLREVARWIAEHGPFVRATARRSAVALATSEESATRLRALGSRYVETFSHAALLDEDLELLGAARNRSEHVIRFVSIGRLIHWKGFDIGLRAFARANIKSSEYWLIGDGREKRRLRALASALQIDERVRFFGEMPREEVLSRLLECDVILHPSLHDSGGWATVEGMAAGLPVICLDLGGPATLITAESGVRIPARDPDQASHDMAAAMIELAQDDDLRGRMSRGARERARRDFRWSSMAERFNAIYQQCCPAKMNDRRAVFAPNVVQEGS